jgi:hypothetical protein
VKRAKLPKGAVLTDALAIESIVVALAVAPSSSAGDGAPTSFVIASIEDVWVELAKIKGAVGLCSLGSQVFALARDGGVVTVDTASGKTTKESVGEKPDAGPMRGVVAIGQELVAFGTGPCARLRLKSGR